MLLPLLKLQLGLGAACSGSSNSFNLKPEFFLFLFLPGSILSIGTPLGWHWPQPQLLLQWRLICLVTVLCLDAAEATLQWLRLAESARPSLSLGDHDESWNKGHCFSVFSTFKEKQWPSLFRHFSLWLYNRYNHQCTWAIDGTLACGRVSTCGRVKAAPGPTPKFQMLKNSGSWMFMTVLKHEKHFQFYFKKI